jgi:diadenosine tetraphosphate (Ap4A) HIT family hydrolase
MAHPAVFKPQASVAGCELCAQPGGTLLWSEPGWRVVRVDDAAFPAFYRVICNHHVAEFSALLAPERRRCMDLVCAVERVLIEQLAPTKVNLAALGNVVPHLHWHVIARFAWDSHFPQPIWGTAQRTPDRPPMSWLGICLEDLDELVVEAVAVA